MRPSNFCLHQVRSSPRYLSQCTHITMKYSRRCIPISEQPPAEADQICTRAAGIRLHCNTVQQVRYLQHIPYYLTIHSACEDVGFLTPPTCTARSRCAINDQVKSHSTDACCNKFFVVNSDFRPRCSILSTATATAIGMQRIYSV